MTRLSRNVHSFRITGCRVAWSTVVVSTDSLVWISRLLRSDPFTLLHASQSPDWLWWWCPSTDRHTQLPQSKLRTRGRRFKYESKDTQIDHQFSKRLLVFLSWYLERTIMISCKRKTEEGFLSIICLSLFAIFIHVLFLYPCLYNNNNNNNSNSNRNSNSNKQSSRQGCRYKNNTNNGSSAHDVASSSFPVYIRVAVITIIHIVRVCVCVFPFLLMKRVKNTNTWIWLLCIVLYILHLLFIIIQDFFFP